MLQVWIKEEVELYYLYSEIKDTDNAPVICIPDPLRAGDSGDIAGLKCLALTSDKSRQCRGCAGVLIFRQ